MTITEDAYLKLLSLPKVPPETGGLLGRHNGVIDSVYFDKSVQMLQQAVYVPDIDALNIQLSEWEGNTDFSGIFHSHLPDSAGLSGEDVRYINLIMMSMPWHISELYFPIVLPGQRILAFRAKNQNNQIFIIEDKITVVKKGRSL